MKKIISSFIFIVLLGFFVAAFNIPKYPKIEHSQEISPPIAYKTLWNKMEECSHLEGDFNRIHWFAVKHYSYRPGFPCLNTHRCKGWWSADHKIYIDTDHLYDPDVIMHEELHDLLGRYNTVNTEKHHPLFKECLNYDR